LSNGLKVVVHEDHSAPLVAVNVWYHVGSGREVEGRSGFAHLFEHMMFQGSQNVKKAEHFSIVQEAGGTLNGSTNSDRTNYYEEVPSNYLERALWLEADRMGYLLDAFSQDKLDNQRDVVKNERRQNYENAPYGLSSIRIGEMLYPKGHPYHAPTIGYQQDLTAAAAGDVEGFFREWYVPNNASLVVAGDVTTAEVRRLVTKYFGPIPSGKAAPPVAPIPVTLDADKRDVMEDRVTLARLSLVWPTVERWHADDVALDILGSILGQGRSSRLYQRLVYKEQAAQSASASQGSRPQAGQFSVTVSAREGTSLSQMEREVYEEIARIAKDGPTEDEMTRARNGNEAQAVFQIQTLLGKADRLNQYVTERGTPDLFNVDLARYRAATAADVRRVAQTYIHNRPHIVLSVVPNGRRELAAQAPEVHP
ncbi:MAG: pitrilysin family protein, partial [Gemmatimonadota bacterium]